MTIGVSCLITIIGITEIASCRLVPCRNKIYQNTQQQNVYANLIEDRDRNGQRLLPIRIKPLLWTERSLYKTK